MENNELFFYPEVKRGENRVVIAGIYDKDTNTIRIGKSECSPKDRFSKAKGRAIALGRAKCPRELKEKEFVQKGKVVKTNKDLLPQVVQLNGDAPILNQFINFVKAL